MTENKILKKCTVCKKRFETPYRDWGYYYGSSICCSYKCMRAAANTDSKKSKEPFEWALEKVEPKIEKTCKKCGEQYMGTEKSVNCNACRLFAKCNRIIRVGG